LSTALVCWYRNDLLADLRGQVGAGVALLVHAGRGELRVAQVELGVRVVDAAGQVLLVAAVGEHLAAALAQHDRGAGVLAHRQHAARRDARVLEQVAGHVPVVGAGLRVVQDGPELAQVAGPQQVRDVPHPLPRQHREHARVHFEEFPAQRSPRGNPVGAEQAVFGAVGA